MTAVSTVPKRGKTIIYTGAPPPLLQIAGQRRSSTGATYGEQAHLLPPGWRGARSLARPSAPVERAEPVPELFATGGDLEQDITALLALLQRLADQRAVLPLCAGLAETLGAEWHRGVASVVHNRMRVMRARRLIEWCYGSSHPWRGEMVVRLVETGQVLRTARAPLDWALPE